jgi:AAA+ superfamily predicted ATPase
MLLHLLLLFLSVVAQGNETLLTIQEPLKFQGEFFVSDGQTVTFLSQELQEIVHLAQQEYTSRRMSNRYGQNNNRISFNNKVVSLLNVLPSLKLMIQKGSIPKPRTSGGMYMGMPPEQSASSSSMEMLKSFVDFLEHAMQEFYKQNINLEESVSFERIQEIYLIGSRIMFTLDHSPVLGRLHVIDLQRNEETLEEMYHLSLQLIDCDGNQFGYVTHHRQIRGFAGQKVLKTLDAYPIPDDYPLEEFIKRGKKYQELAIGVHHLHYSGLAIDDLIVQTFTHHGRVIVDAVAYDSATKELQRYGGYMGKFQGIRAQSKDDSTSFMRGFQFTPISEIPEDQLWMTTPCVYGFSLSDKKWFMLNVNQLSPIIFVKNAFEMVVAKESSKSLLRAVVTNYKKSQNLDFISGKANGVIINLHGPSGTGKTVTCEAIAEELELPLYSVAAGELGTSPERLEYHLREVLRNGARWNAILLLDEADIFLERRDHSDIKRNAMVGIFLRYLEYHTGVLFLTTNRIDSYDEAFQTRILLKIHYDNLTPQAKKTIWRNFLDRGGENTVTSTDIDYFVNHMKVNAREIRNVVRMAICIAAQTDEPVSRKHIESILDETHLFTEDSNK